MSEQIKTVDNYIQNLQKTINSLKTINGELVNENARLRGQNKALRVNINKHHDELNKLKVYNHQRSEEHTSELQSRQYLVCRLLLEKKKKKIFRTNHNIIKHKQIHRHTTKEH